MAKEREFVDIEDVIVNGYEINEYTIKYDPQVKRFFKGFAPNVAKGGLLSAAVFAGLGLATVVTGGIAGFGIGAIAGVSAVAGVSFQSAYSGIVYGRNNSQSRFKALKVGGKDIVLTTDERNERIAKYEELLKKNPLKSTFKIEGKDYSRKELRNLIDSFECGKTGTIGLIDAHDSRTLKYIKLLNDFPDKTEFEFEESVKVSRKELKKIIDTDKESLADCEEFLNKYNQLLSSNPKKNEFVLEDGVSYSRDEIQRRVDEYAEDKIKYENRINKHNKLLEDSPNQRQFVIITDVKYSRADINRSIKDSEDIAYHGLKYILREGIHTSARIKKLVDIGEDKLSRTDRAKLAEYQDEMTRIRACVENLVISRKFNFNPYKALIVDAIHDGCLLGNDEQNEQIKAVAVKGKKKDAFDLYYTMYEQKLLDEAKKKSEETLNQLESVKQDKERAVRTSKELIKNRRDIDKVSKDIKERAKQMNEHDSYRLLLDKAEELVVGLPQDLAKERRELGLATTDFRKAIDSDNQTEIKKRKDNLDKMVYDVYGRLRAWYVESGRKSAGFDLDTFKQQFEEYKTISKQQRDILTKQLDKQTKKYKNAVELGLRQRKTTKDLREDLSNAQTDVDIAMSGWFGASEQNKKDSQTIAKQGSTIKQQQKQIADEQARSAGLKTERDSAVKRANIAEGEAYFTHLAWAGERNRAQKAEDATKKARRQTQKAKKQTQRAIDIAQMAIAERNDAKEKLYVTKEKLDARTEELGFVVGYNEEISGTVTALYDNFTQAEQDLDKTAQQLRDAEERAKAQKAKTKKAGGLIARLIAKGRGLEEELTKEKESRQVAEEMFNAEQTERLRLEGENKTLKGKLIKSVGDNADLHKTVDGQGATIDDLQHRLGDAIGVAGEIYGAFVRENKERIDVTNKYGVAKLKGAKTKAQLAKEKEARKYAEEKFSDEQGRRVIVEKENATLHDDGKRKQAIIDDQTRQLFEEREYIATLEGGQRENIDTIIGLQVGNEKLTTRVGDLESELRKSKEKLGDTLAEVAKSAEIIADKDRTIANQGEIISKQGKKIDELERESNAEREATQKAQAEIATLEDKRTSLEDALQKTIEYAQRQSDDAEYAEGVAFEEYTGRRTSEGELAERKYKRDRGAVKTRLDKKVREYWDHIKITRDKEPEKYGESTSKVQEKLDAVIMIKNNPETSLEQLRIAEMALVECYKQESSNWPKYKKDKTKTEIIPGTPVPESEYDNIYYSK